MGKKSSTLSVTESLFIGAHSHKDLLLLTVAEGRPLPAEVMHLGGSTTNRQKSG